MAAESGLPTGHANAPRADGISLFFINIIDGAESPVLTRIWSFQVMCVLMVCINVLELLLDETALPRGMEVRHSQEDRFMLAVSQSVISVFLCAIGSSPGIGFFLHVRFTGCCSSSPPYSVSNRFFAVFTFYVCIWMPFMMLSLTLNSSYLMVSSVVGFYSSPFFTGILPRAKDTNLTQVYDRYRSHAAYFVSVLRITADVILCLVSDHRKLHVTAHPQLSAASLFTHNW